MENSDAGKNPQIFISRRVFSTKNLFGKKRMMKAEEKRESNEFQ
jgi:hypothetical protein